MKKLKQNEKNYKHFSHEERKILETGLSAGKTQKDIALILNRHPSTISREIKRNEAPVLKKPYLCIQAIKRCDDRKRRSHAKIRLKNQIIRDYVEEKLKIGWTPEIIAGRISMELPGEKTNHESIYLYIYKQRREFIKYLPQGRNMRRKRASGKSKRLCKIANRTFIDDRPDIINKKLRRGDWEADTIVSRQSKAALVVLKERKLQITLIRKVQRKTADATEKAIIKMLEKFPENLRRSITFDNGTEFSFHKKIAKKLNLDTYFCHPYHSWEKGSVENANGLIRRFFPKKTDFSLICWRDIKAVEKLLNNRPRKILGYLTPNEVLGNCA